MEIINLYLKSEKDIAQKTLEYILKVFINDNYILEWNNNFGTLILSEGEKQLANLYNNYKALEEDLEIKLAIVIVPLFSEELSALVKNKCPFGIYHIVKYLPNMLSDDKHLKDKLLSFKKEITEDVLETIKVYLEANCSLSLTSKIMFIHRNTINYRITRFIELTNINIRFTLNGYYVYLLITWDESSYNKFLGGKSIL